MIQITVGTNTLVAMAKQMHRRGEITDSQMDDIIERSKTIPEEHRKNILLAK